MAEKIIKQYIKAVNTRDYPLIKQTVTDDYTFHMTPDMSWGYEETYLVQFKALLEQDGRTFKLDDLEDNGETAIVKSTEVIPDSDEVPKHYVEKFRFENGKIAEHWVISH